MSQKFPGASARAFSPLTAKLDLDRHGRPLATLSSRPFNDVEMNAAQMRGLARLLDRLADATERYSPKTCARRAIVVTAEEASS
jgi:hypothetical protein